MTHTVHLQQQKMQNDIKEAFGLLDVDGAEHRATSCRGRTPKSPWCLGSGTVSSSELTVMLAALGIEMTELEVRDMVAEVDKDRSGEVKTHAVMVDKGDA